MRRKWLTETMMLKQEIQVVDMDISTILKVKHAYFPKLIFTKHDCQELNETDKAPHGMTNKKNKYDSDKQECNGDFSSSRGS